MDRILDLIQEKTQPTKGFFDLQTYPEDNFVTIISDFEIPKKILGVIHKVKLPSVCTNNKIGFIINQL